MSYEMPVDLRVRVEDALRSAEGQDITSVVLSVFAEWLRDRSDAHAMTWRGMAADDTRRPGVRAQAEILRHLGNRIDPAVGAE